jgi:hypothetical protein
LMGSLKLDFQLMSKKNVNFNKTYIIDYWLLAIMPILI